MKTVFKRIVGLCLALTMLLTFTTAFSYAASGSCGKNLKWELEKGKLTITGSGEMDDYDAADEAPWYEQRFSITEITIGSDVTSIGAYAFCGLENLVTADCGKVKSIGDYAFYCCANMDSATLAEGVTYIGDSAFENCNVLSQLEIPESVEIIGDSAFKETEIVGKFTFSNALQEIGAKAFYMCNHITGIAISDSVKTIGEEAFYNCDLLEEVSIGKGVTAIGERAFAYCTDMKSFTVASGNTAYTVVNDALLTKDGKTLVAYPIDKAESAAVPSTVKEIASGAFAGSYTITSVSLPSGLEIIGDSAFMDCWYLESVSFPSTLKSIGALAFATNFEITEINIPANVSEIGDGAFSDMHELTSFTVASSNKKFAAINDILYNNDVTVLVSCPSGKTGSAFVQNTVEEIVPYAFFGSAATSVSLPTGLKTIGDYAFGHSAIKSITIPANVNSIGEEVFTDSRGLTSINVSSSNKAYEAVNGVLFTEDMKTLISYPAGKSAENYTIPNGVVEIRDDAFRYAAITGVTIPNSVKTIGEYTFADCYDIKEVSLPFGLQTVGEYAFAWCSGLNKVTFGGPTFINMRAFCWCSELDDIEFKGAAPSDISDMAFFGCGDELTITYVDGNYGWTTPTWKGYTTSNNGKVTIIPGDVDGDGRITNSDLVRVAQHIVNIITVDESAGDFDGSGSVDNADLVGIARIIVGL